MIVSTLACIPGKASGAICRAQCSDPAAKQPSAALRGLGRSLRGRCRFNARGPCRVEQESNGQRSAIWMSPGSGSALGFVHGGTIPVHQGFSFLPWRVSLSIVRFETPTGAAWVKFMPSHPAGARTRRVSPRINFLVGYSTPLNSNGVPLRWSPDPPCGRSGVARETRQCRNF